MTDETNPIIQDFPVPPIEPIEEIPVATDPMQQILQGMLAMQAQTNQTLEKIVDKIDAMENKQEVEQTGIKSQEDMVKEMWSTKIRQMKMYKVLIIKSVLPMAAQDQQLHGDQFANWGIVRGDTNKWFDNEKEAKAYGESIAPGKYKLLPVSTPIPEWWKYTARRPNITM